MKTVKTGASVKAFLDGVASEARRADAKAFDRLVRRVTGAKPAMWGSAIVGYGDSTITYADGRELPWMKFAFSPRAASLTLYLSPIKSYAPLLKKLGPHKVSGGCLHIKALDTVDGDVLEAIVEKAFT